jgi:hypothetical protein
LHRPSTLGAKISAKIILSGGFAARYRNFHGNPRILAGGVHGMRGIRKNDQEIDLAPERDAGPGVAMGGMVFQPAGIVRCHLAEKIHIRHDIPESKAMLGQFD